jgi:ferredoxin
MRLVADRDICVGSGLCVLTASQVFDQDPNDGLVVLLTDRLESADADAARKAVALCPSGALSIVEE